MAYQVVEDKTEVPSFLYEPTPEPEFWGDDNMSLLEWGLDTRDALRSCNDDKRALGAIYGKKGQ